MTPGFGSEEMLVVNSKTEYTGKGLLVPNWLHLNAYTSILCFQSCVHISPAPVIKEAHTALKHCLQTLSS